MKTSLLTPRGQSGIEQNANANLVLDQMITPQGKLSLSALVTSLHLVPNTILIVKTDGDPMPIVEALQAIELPFDVPIILMKRDENLLTCDKKKLEDALEVLAQEDTNGNKANK